MKQLIILGAIIITLYTLLLYIISKPGSEPTLKLDASYAALTYICADAKIIPQARHEDTLDAAIVAHGDRVFLPAYMDALGELPKRDIKVIQLACHEL